MGAWVRAALWATFALVPLSCVRQVREGKMKPLVLLETGDNAQLSHESLGAGCAPGGGEDPTLALTPAPSV